MLNEYNVHPIEYYNMVKASTEGIDKLVIRNPLMYGYYTDSGDCYKIYQPKQKSYKSVSYTHLRAHETVLDLVCRLLLGLIYLVTLTAVCIITIHQLVSYYKFVNTFS